jgi:uncharacterized membrane protein YiaA
MLKELLRGAQTAYNTGKAAGSYHTDRAQGNMVGLFIGLMIAAIVALQVFSPVVNDAINSANLTSTQETVVTLLPLFAVLLLLIALAGPLMNRV